MLSGKLLVKPGVTLVLPYSSDRDPDGTKDAASVDDASAKLSPNKNMYILVNVPKGSVLTVEGTLIVGGVLSKPFTFDYQGHTSGPFAMLSVNGEVILKSGSSFYAYGFVKGAGTLAAHNGSKVYEPMVVTDYVGGDRAYVNYDKGQAPFNRYALCNIQCNYVMESDARLLGMINLYANNTYNKRDVSVAGPDNGLIILSKGSVLRSEYDIDVYLEADWSSNIYRDIGKKTVTISGGAKTGSIVMEVQGRNVDTGTTEFSVPYNFDIILENGEYTILKQYRFLPGSSLTVSEDAVLNVSGKLIVYDGLKTKEFRDKYYPDSGLLKNFVPRDKTYRFSTVAGLYLDGTMIVSGSFAGLVQSSSAGGVFKSEPGAVLSFKADFGAKGSFQGNDIDDLTSRDMACYMYGSGNTVIYPETGKAYYSTDGSTHTLASYKYTEDKKENTVTINQTVNGTWRTGTLTVTYNAGTGSGTPPVDSRKYTPGDMAVVMGKGSLYKTGSEFEGWSLSPGGSGELLQPGSKVRVGSNLVLYAMWSQNTFTVNVVKDSDHGKIVQGDKITSSSGGSVLVSAVPDDGYTVSGIKLDGKSMGSSDTLRITGINSDHTVTVIFAVSEGTRSSATSNGAVTETTESPAGDSTLITTKFSDTNGKVSVSYSGKGPSGENVTVSGNVINVIAPVPGNGVLSLGSAAALAAAVAEKSGIASPAYALTVTGGSDPKFAVDPVSYEFLAASGMKIVAGGWNISVPKEMWNQPVRISGISCVSGKPNVMTLDLDKTSSGTVSGAVNASAGGSSISVPAAFVSALDKKAVFAFGTGDSFSGKKGDYLILSAESGTASGTSVPGDIKTICSDGRMLSVPAKTAAGSVKASGGYHAAVTSVSPDGRITADVSGNAPTSVTLPYSLSVKDPVMNAVAADGTKTPFDCIFSEGNVSFEVSGPVSLVIEASEVHVSGVTLNKTSIKMNAGESDTLFATVSPSNATNKNVSWKSSNASVATVDNGKVKAVSAGVATITVTTEDGGYNAVCTVTVVVPVTGVSLNKTSLSIKAGSSETLTATVTPSDATDKGISWSSSNTSVATVANGIVEGKAPGTATVTVKTADGGHTASCKVTVLPDTVRVTGVSLNRSYLELHPGENSTLAAIITPSDATDKNVTWSTSDAKVATVTGGKVTAVAPGTATITVVTADGGYRDNCTVSVVAAPVVIDVTGVFLNETSLNLEEGKSETVFAVVMPVNATNRNVAWKTSDASVAAVEDGKITALSPGTAVITVTTEDGGYTAECAVTVLPPVVRVTGVSVDKSVMELVAGESGTLAATVTPSDATDKNVAWSSGDDKVATVSDGKVIAVSPGIAVITVKTEDGGYTAECSVIVSEAPVKVTGVVLSKSTLSLETGDYATLAATVMPSDAADKTVVWSTSNASVASVEDGKIAALSPGTAVITVKTEDGGFTAECKVTVSPAPVRVTGVSLDKSSASLIAGDSSVLAATVMPSDAADKSVVWSTSDASVAIVNGGTVTAVSAGTATITVTTRDGGYTASCLVTVSDAPVDVTGVSLDKSSINIAEGDSSVLTASVVPDNATNKNVTWSTSDAKVAAVSGGTVKGISAGTAIVTVTTEDGNYAASCTVIVSPAAVKVTGVSLDKTKITVGAGDTAKLTATVVPSDASDKNVTWGTSDGRIATVSGGIVKGISAGTAIVTVTTEDGNYTASCTVTVEEKSSSGDNILLYAGIAAAAVIALLAAVLFIRGRSSS